MSVNNGNVVKGDGHAFGDGNIIHVNKLRTTIHHGSGSEGENGPALVIGGIVMLAFALAGAAYLFAQYADPFYNVASWAAAGFGGIAFVSMCIKAMKQFPARDIGRDFFTLVVAAVSGLAAVYGGNNYPQDMVHLAQDVSSMSLFWCNLNDSGQRIALQHLPTALAIAVSLLLLLPHVATALCESLTHPHDAFIQGWKRWAPNGTLVVGALLIVAAEALYRFAPPYFATLAAEMGHLLCHAPPA